MYNYVDENGVAVIGELVSEKFDELKQDLTQITDTIVFNEKINTRFFGKFAQGGLEGVTLDYQKYRVSSITPILAKSELKLTVADGFRFGFVITDSAGTEAGIWSGWTTTGFIIPKDTFFKLQIARVTEDYSEKASVDEFTSAIICDSVFDSIKEDIDNVNTNIDEVSTNINKINDLIYPLQLFSGNSQFLGGWKKVIVADNLNLVVGKSYSITIKLETAPETSSYISLYRQDKTAITNAQLMGLTEAIMDITPLKNEEDCYIEITSESYKGQCVVTAAEKEDDKITKNSKQVKQIEDGYKTFEGSFVHGNYYSTLEQYDKYKVVSLLPFKFDYNISVKCDDGYDFIVNYFDDNGVYLNSSGWKQYGEVYEVLANSLFRVCVASKDLSVVVDVEETKTKVQYSTKIEQRLLKIESDTVSASNLFHIIKRNKYFSHIDVDYYTGLIIPSQSIFDVRRSKRLGFEMMELNVRKTTDGVFYSFHGSKNCFGDAFQSVDGTDISEVDVSTVTSDYIQTNIRYKSKYSKYQVAPSTLRDTLIECKKYDIVPLIEYSDGVVDFAKSIMGDNLFLLGTYNKDRSTLDCGDCVCVSWLTGTAETVIAKAQKSKGAYVCGINVTDSMYADYTVTDWSNFIDEIHKAGYFVSCAYQNQAQVQKLLNGGIDIMASRGEINDIEYGNLFNSESDMTYSDFSTNGSVSDGVLSLTSGKTVTPNGIAESVFLGGASLHVIFKGKIHVKMGVVDAEFESDGKKTMWFSSFFQETVPSFLITAVEDTEILEISFKASKM